MNGIEQQQSIEMSRRDRGAEQDEHSSGSNSSAASSNDDDGHPIQVLDDDDDSLLGVYQAASLLTADILGTGLLALPNNIKVLGNVVGLSFLILNLPLNLYAGTLLSKAATHVERDENSAHPTNTTAATNGRDGLMRSTSPPHDNNNNGSSSHEDPIEPNNGDGLVRVVRSSLGNRSKQKYSSVHGGLDHSDQELSYRGSGSQLEAENSPTAEIPAASPSSNKSDEGQQHLDEAMDEHAHATEPQHHTAGDDDKEYSSTWDFIGVTQALFHHPVATQLVTAIFYGNIFLVLGDYILVQSHAVAAVVGEGSICLPTAGILASTLMLAFCQLRTMANLGHTVTFLSLACLSIVVLQCLVAAERHEPAPGTFIPPTQTAFLRKLSALASIGFATGTNKLLLNIRHEMKYRDEAPKTLAISQVAFGSFYVSISVLAGPNPPSFLFDSIPAGPSRRIAGLLLWIHVAVSYAINSQAICASIDRRYYHPVAPYQHPRKRWLILTMCLVLSSYLVANVVPFFKDLVALIGALTTVPLTLLLPVLFHRRSHNMPLWCPTRETMASYGLLIFGFAFLVVGLAGSLGSIEMDWSNQGGPFSCTV